MTHPVEINTTFHVESGSVTDFLDWIKAFFVPAVRESSLTGNCSIAEIMVETAPDTKGYALRFSCPDIDSANRWFAQTGNALLADLSRKHGEKIVFFITPMRFMDF